MAEWWLVILAGSYMSIAELVFLGLGSSEDNPNLTRVAIIALLWPYYGTRNFVLRVKRDIAELRQFPAITKPSRLRPPLEIGLYD